LIDIPTISKFNDVTKKWGMGYQLSDGSYGVYFNDKSSIILPFES